MSTGSMRLFNIKTRQLESFFGQDAPPYAILSHRWGPEEEELTFRDVQEGQILAKPGIGARKLRGCGDQAESDGLKYIWIDTFCINKADDATELSKAINSMFQWYRDAAACYAYLHDVPDNKDETVFSKSEWFRRGWTLQELLAPDDVHFFDAEWRPLGTKKKSLSSQIEAATGISAGFLEGVWAMDDASVAQRMSWAASRVTKEPEDMAYCLLGIFGVNMPLIYGEGLNAFHRLQEEITKMIPDDDSILAWGMDGPVSMPSSSSGAASPATTVKPSPRHIPPNRQGGVLASSPAHFHQSGAIVPSNAGLPMSWSSRAGCLGVEISVYTVQLGAMEAKYGLLHCHAVDDPGMIVGISLEPSPSGRPDEYIRPVGGKAILLPERQVSTSPPRQIHILMRPGRPGDRKTTRRERRFWVRGLQQLGLRVTETSPECSWDTRSSIAVAPVAEQAPGRVWLRVQQERGAADLPDFLLLLENRLGETTRYSLLVCSRNTPLPRRGDGDFPIARNIWENHRASNSALCIEVDLKEHFVGRRSTFIAELAESPSESGANNSVNSIDLSAELDQLSAQAGIVDELAGASVSTQIALLLGVAAKNDREMLALVSDQMKTAQAAREAYVLVQEAQQLGLLEVVVDSTRDQQLSAWDEICEETCKKYEEALRDSQNTARWAARSLESLGGIRNRIADLHAALSEMAIKNPSLGNWRDGLFAMIAQMDPPSSPSSGGIEDDQPKEGTTCRFNAAGPSSSERRAAIRHAAINRRLAILVYLRSLGADLDAELVSFGQQGLLSEMEQLLDAGAAVDGADQNGAPLLSAAAEGQLPAVQLLLRRGANRTILDHAGKTAAELASAKGHAEVVESLQHFRPPQPVVDDLIAEVVRPFDINWDNLVGRPP